VLSVAEPAPSDTAAWLARLNDAQREAVEYDTGNVTQPTGALLVIAGSPIWSSRVSIPVESSC
jgi:DNA helicase-2/ATP-dependent DNA helicase PcrA